MTTFNTLLEKITEAYQNQLPFVAYKKPNSNLVSAFFQNSDALNYVKDYSEKGFVFAPFNNDGAAILLPEDNRMQAVFDVEVIDNKNFNLQRESNEVKEKHIALVERTKKFLEETSVSKIVIARTKDISSEGFELTNVFLQLLKKYAKATTYVWYHPKVGLWMGATPEMLLEIKGTSFQTMSLAGTQPFVDTMQVTWGAKEIEEQKLVTDYVLDNLKNQVNSVKYSDTYTSKAGSLLHLRTDITGTVSEDNGVVSLLRVLHPTPAVCGFPRVEAQKFILANENFDRSFYTGFFGELNIENATRLYVNLRCIEKRNENTIRLYVGGGITKLSEPEKEWEETVAKCKTMESVLF